MPRCPVPLFISRILHSRKSYLCENWLSAPVRYTSRARSQDVGVRRSRQDLHHSFLVPARALGPPQFHHLCVAVHGVLWRLTAGSRTDLKIMVSPVRIRVPPLKKVLQLTRKIPLSLGPIPRTFLAYRTEASGYSFNLVGGFWVNSAYRVCMPMRNLPSAVFAPKEYRSPQRV